jgi:hypothetical protein
MNRERSSSANKVGKKSAFPILIASILLFTLAYPVAAQVPKPAGYYGSLMIDGNDAPANTTVIAKIGNDKRGELITKKPGYYGSLQEPLWVTGYEGENNPVVTFWVIYNGEQIECSSPSSVIWVSGEIVTIPATATSNPVVTDPSANPGSIPADGTTTSQLNVTVTDNVGVASVIVNLSALGGSATQMMTNIPGTDIYRATTTAAVGTDPDTYLLNVNATDGAGNYNDTVSIELEITLAASAATTTISIQDVTVSSGESATVPIMITDVTDVGVAAIEFSFNPSVVHVTAVTDSQFDMCDPTIDNVTGEFEIAGVQFMSPGLNGNVRLATVTLKAVGTAGQSSPLNLTINELKTVGPPSQNIPADVDEGMFTIIGVAENEPSVETQTQTQPTATPSPALTPAPTPPPPVAPTSTPVVTPVVTPIVTPIITPTPPPVLELPPVIPLYVILIAIVVALVIIAGAYWLQRR